MLDHVLGLARERGRARMVASVHTPYDGPPDGTGHPDRDWVAHRGFELDISNVVRVLDLPDDILEELGRLVEAQMVAINETFGFRAVEREVELVRAL